MNVRERLLQINGGVPDTLGNILLKAGGGQPGYVWQLLKNYSGLSGGTVRQHLMVIKPSRRFAIRGISTVTKLIRGVSPL